MKKHSILYTSLICGLLSTSPVFAYEVEGCVGDCNPCELRNSCVTDGYIDSYGTLHLHNGKRTTIGNKEYLCTKRSRQDEVCKTVEEWVKVLNKQERECRAYQSRMEKECEKYKQTDEYKAQQEAMNHRYELDDRWEKINARIAERGSIDKLTSEDMAELGVTVEQPEDETPMLGKAQNKLNELGSELFKKIF